MKLHYLFILFSMFYLISCKPGSLFGGAQSSSISDIESIKRGEYRIGLFYGGDHDIHKVTHIIVVGSAMKEDSDQFFQSGLSRAYRYKEVWPDHQIIIMSSPDVKGMTDEDVFKKYKIPVIKQVNRKFTGELLLDEIGTYTQIASLDYYGHSSPWALKIGKNNAALDTTAHQEIFMALRKNFLPDAYATLNACNTGFYLAPALSKALAIPVSGSLTSSLFQRIESDGAWYKEDDWRERKGPLENKTSYRKNLSCSQGACTRMRADRENYSSYWGTFKEGGLSFDKFFCNYENNKDGSCERGMALSLMGFPSVAPINLESDQEDLKSVLFDWLCSTGKGRSYFRRCVNGIEDAVARGDLQYQSHPTNELICDFNSCHADVLCKYGTFDNFPIEGTCHLRTFQNNDPTNVATEYLSFLRGFELIRK